MEITLQLSPSDKDIAAIYEGLKEFNQSMLPGLHEQTLGIFVKSDAGEIVGGLAAKQLYDSILINYLWLSAPARKRGFGTALMAKLETYAKEQGVARFFVDTYSFQAPAFYERLGFTETGRYKDCPKVGIDKIFYSKSLP